MFSLEKENPTVVLEVYPVPGFYLFFVLHIYEK